MKEKNYSINVTKEEMIRYYANKIVEDGIKDCNEFSNVININEYSNIEKYKGEILNQIYRDERVADVYLDEEGNFDMVFYTDYCPYYYEEDEDNLVNNKIINKKILENFASYYALHCLYDDPYISTRRLIYNFIDYTDRTNNVYNLKVANMLKKCIIESGFMEKYMENTEVFITPKNYKEFEKLLLRMIEKENSKEEEEEL